MCSTKSYLSLTCVERARIAEFFNVCIVIAFII